LGEPVPSLLLSRPRKIDAGGARNLKENLPYSQALLDLNEIWARQMAALAPGEFPGGRGDNFAAARDNLDARVKAFCRERYKQFEIEREAFVKETKRGENKEKARELSAAIRNGSTPSH
jgi:hypothetical protein